MTTDREELAQIIRAWKYDVRLEIADAILTAGYVKSTRLAELEAEVERLKANQRTDIKDE